MITYPKAITLTSIIRKESVVFAITPEVAVSKQVTYVEISDIRLPSSILIWMGSPSRNFSITAKLFARTTSEADLAYNYKSLLESWCLPTKNLLAKKTSKDPKAPKNNTQTALANARTSANIAQTNTANGNSLFEDTPEVLYLIGYSGQFREIPVVIRGLNIAFPSEVDYIKTTDGIDVPIMQEIGIQLTEARNIEGETSSIDTFNIDRFRKGILPHW